MKIALIGVDGAGKSTILADISKHHNTRILYMGFRGFRLQKIITALSALGKLGLILRHLIVYIENLFRYLKAMRLERKGYIVLFDRYPLVDYQVASVGSKHIYDAFYKHFFPRPDKIILIKGNKDEIYKRKPELTLIEIGLLQARLEKIKIIDFTVVNTTGKLDETIRRVKEIIGI